MFKPLLPSFVNIFVCRLCWKAVFDIAVNVALLRPTVQSSTYSTAVASLAVDGDLNTVSCTDMFPLHTWWSVDLGAPMDVGRVCVVNDHDEIWG